MQSVHPYLNFPGTTEEAFSFYRSVFGGEFTSVVRFRDFPDNSMGVPDAELDRIAHIGLPLAGGAVLMATDHVSSFPQDFTPGNNFSIALAPDDAAEAQRLYDGLGEGGVQEMPLMRTEWAELHGHVVDRFGVRWMIDYEGAGGTGLPG